MIRRPSCCWDRAPNGDHVVQDGLASTERDLEPDGFHLALDQWPEEQLHRDVHDAPVFGELQMPAVLEISTVTKHGFGIRVLPATTAPRWHR